VLKSGSYPVDLALGNTVPCSYIAPLRDEFADLCGYFMSRGRVQLKILGRGLRESQGGGAVIFIDRRGQDARLYIGRHRVEVVGR
jgi:hypothetical protein